MSTVLVCLPHHHTLRLLQRCSWRLQRCNIHANTTKPRNKTKAWTCVDEHETMTRSILILILLVSVACMALAASDRNQIGSLRLLEDTFNFDKTTESTGKETGTSFGPKDWGLVRCNDVETCPGYPTNWKDFNVFIPYDKDTNTCQDCNARYASSNKNCIEHKQSPIALFRNVTRNRACGDRHLMKIERGNCRLEKIKFRILPHALRAYQPICSVLPAIDFSFGFPEPWLLRYTDITIPSQHTLDGKRFHAEIILSHTYSNRTAEDKLIGNVAIMVDVGGASDHYPFFELFLRGWEATASRVALSCNNNALTRRLGDTSNTTNKSPWSQDEPSAQNASSRNLSLARSFNVGRPQFIRQPYYVGPYHPYIFYKDTGTEYYFRYEGSVIEPPCLEFVHWRVLRLPIKISPLQFKRLENLLDSRQDPKTCQLQNVGRTRRSASWKKDFSRPLQNPTKSHKLVYCECINWKSRAPKDAAHCNLSEEKRGVFDVKANT